MNRRIIALSMAIAFAPLSAQQPEPPAFEVASIKPSAADPGSSSGIQTERGRLRGRNVTLKRCVRGAYGIPDDQILGGPKWIDEKRYEIDAKSTAPADDAELNLMLQTLLADRFKLAVHRETKPLSGYALVVAKGGLKIRASVPGTPAATNSSRGLLDATACGMDRLALKLSLELHQPVADLTGVAGIYDLKLQWTPEELRVKTTDDGSAAPSLFSAVQEQLGLKLEPSKVPTKVLVVDRAEEPSAN